MENEGVMAFFESKKTQRKRAGFLFFSAKKVVVVVVVARQTGGGDFEAHEKKIRPRDFGSGVQRNETAGSRKKKVERDLKLGLQTKSPDGGRSAALSGDVSSEQKRTEERDGNGGWGKNMSTLPFSLWFVGGEFLRGRRFAGRKIFGQKGKSLVLLW